MKCYFCGKEDKTNIWGVRRIILDQPVYFSSEDLRGEETGSATCICRECLLGLAKGLVEALEAAGISPYIGHPCLVSESNVEEKTKKRVLKA
jgi:hypothetical protein